MSGAMNAPININIQANNLAILGAIRASVDSLRTALNNLERTAAGAGRAMTGFENSIRGLDRTMKYILAGSVVGLSGGFIKMASDLERLQITLATIENSFEKADVALDRMLVLTQKAPFSLTAIHEAFVKLRSSGIEPIIDDAGNGPLKNLLDAVAAFGGTDEQVKRVSLAIEQMAGKGVISMEELRRQMGQQIPTAIRLMAEGMGISVAKLISDISRGTVAFNDAVPPMLDKFKEKYGGAGDLLANTFSGSLRLATAEVNKFAVTLNKSGALDVLTSAVLAAVKAMRYLNSAATVTAVQEWMASLLRFADRNADAFVRAVATIQDFGTAFVTIVSAIFGAVSQLPAEAVAGGVIGWLIFGRAGLVVGAILGPSTEVVMGVTSAISSLFGAVVSIIGASGIETTSIATYGVIGWLLFGRTGLLAGVLLSLVDRFFGAIRTNLATMFADLAGIAAGVADPLNFGKAFTGAKEEFRKNNTSTPANPDGGKGFFGFGDITKNPFEELFSKNAKADAADAAQGISRISEVMQELRANIAKTREEFDGKFGQPNDIPGLSTNATRGIEKFGQAFGQVEDRLKAAKGSPLDSWVSRQKRAADRFETDVIKPMEDSWRKFNEQGKTRDADLVMKSLTDAREQLDTFRKNVESVEALERRKTNLPRTRGFRSGASSGDSLENLTSFGGDPDGDTSAWRRGASGRLGRPGSVRSTGALGRYETALETLNTQLTAFEERFTHGSVSAESEAAKIESQFAPMVRQIGNMRDALVTLKGSESDRAIVLEELSFVEERLNHIRAQGIAIAERKSAREKSDAIQDAARSVRTLGSQASVAELGQSMFGADQADIISRKEAAQAQVDGITDKVTELRRRLEDTPGDTWLPQFIDKLEQIRGRFIALRDNVGTTQEALNKISRDLGDNVGKALEDGLGSSIEAMITRTKSLGDVVKSMYAEITRAAIQYLMKQALIAAGSSDGTVGSLLKSLIGVGAGAGAAAGAAASSVPVFTDANIPSARGNVFSKFAGGGTFTNSIVRGPTQFPIGLMGEAGPEAVMPLTNVNGKLGVAASRGGGDNYSINITAVDAASVARLFSDHGGALVETMRQRDRLNRGYGKR